MSFQEVSSKIIKDAINAAVYIDDKVLLPFEEIKDGLINQSELFYSFKENNCYLDFYRHSKGAEKDYKKILINKDLLILDWHLSNDETDLSATFNILELAVNTQSLHFSVIYTNQRQETLPQSVILNIASYFSGLDKTLVEAFLKKYKTLIESTEWDKEVQAAFTDKLKQLSTELFFELHNKKRQGEIFGEVFKLIRTIGENKEFEDFLNEVELPVKDFKNRLIYLSFILNKSSIPEKGQQYKNLISSDKYTIRVNNLFIKVVSKDIKDAELYDEFTNSLIKESNIFLTLLGLEIQNRFKETSRFIGNELDDLNQLAFFYHRKSHFTGHENLFDEFLKDIWKDQVASFLIGKNIELLDVIDEFKAENDIEKRLASFTKADSKAVIDLARLNFVYNRLAIKRNENDEIRFGDIFLLSLNEQTQIYLLCLTPHCDCLRPGKIKNMFFFVEGKDIGATKGVEKSDGDFISFIESVDREFTTIDWTNDTNDCKPFSFYIENNQMQGEKKTISINYMGKDKEAVYLCTLKENYAQRIANKAFSYPLRVGIDFATFKSDLEKDSSPVNAARNETS